MSRVVLLGILFLTLRPCYADESKSAAAGASAPPAAVGKSEKGARRGHERGAGKKAVLSLQSLTDKQKAQIGAIYDGDKPKWEALQSQMRELHQSEWTKVKGVLTADQLKELQSEKHRGRRLRESSQKEASEKESPEKEAAESSEKSD